MPMIYQTREGDVLDAICAAHYGLENLAETVIGVLEHNPGLADKGAIYSAGIRITLLQLTQSVVTAPYSLWD